MKDFWDIAQFSLVIVDVSEVLTTIIRATLSGAKKRKTDQD
jgi:hypothetical protein